MIKVGLLVLGLLLGGIAEAGTVQFSFGGTPVTVTTTAGQDQFLTRLLTRQNAQRAGREPPLPAQTLEEYLRDLFMRGVQGLKEQSDDVARTAACTQWTGLTPGQKATIVGLLGDTPCP